MNFLSTEGLTHPITGFHFLAWGDGPPLWRGGGLKGGWIRTTFLVLDIYEKSRSFKSIFTCVLEQSPILLGGLRFQIIKIQDFVVEVFAKQYWLSQCILSTLTFMHLKCENSTRWIITEKLWKILENKNQRLFMLGMGKTVLLLGKPSKKKGRS